MIYVDDGVINLTRGDDATITVPLKQSDGTEYTLDVNEYLIFALREQPDSSSELLLEIRSNNGENIINISHSDTNELKTGFYSAEIQMMANGGKRITVWPKLTGQSRTSKSNRKNFCLMTEVVYE